MNDLVLVFVLIAASVGVSSGQEAQTQHFIPCSRAYYQRICNVPNDDDGVADWITDQLNALIACNGPNTAQFAAGVASICARDPNIQMYCGEAQYYLPDILEYMQTDCADAIADEFVNCSPECAGSLTAIRNSLGCCINTIFNLTGPDQFTTIEVGFSYSLWSRCNVSSITSTCNFSITYEVSADPPSSDCNILEQNNRVAAALCIPEEKRVRDEALANMPECTNFNLYLDSYCTRDPVANRYCLTRDGDSDTQKFIEPIRQYCQSNESCSDQCRNSLQEFQNDLGCCLNVVYNQTSQILGLDTFPLEDDSLFQLCGLSTPEATCPVSTSQAQTLKGYGFTVILLLFVVLLHRQLS